MIATNITTPAITTATAMATILPDDIFDFAVGNLLLALDVSDGARMTVLVTTEPPMVCNDCVVMADIVALVVVA